ncbi:hypothetical protein N7522_002991 [Penicillium canescens]|nr:hypothetical protein N7522_002991 [Penicillium canescens]
MLSRSVKAVPTLVLVLYYLSSVLANTIGQASNFNISAAVAEEYGCNQTCQQINALANVADLNTLGVEFDYSFYNTAVNFSSSKPGDVLKITPINSSKLSIPAGIAAYKIQYTSLDIDGAYVPVTGFVALPFTLPYKTKKFPLLAYAHGTIGIYRGCAPSSSPELFDYNTWTALTARGYAIVATDYAGLGNNYTAHKYVNFAAHANDIYYSVVAARKAFGSILTHKWASVGHSQGGGAVWKLAEHPKVQDNSSGYLGTVALSAPAKVYDMAVWAWNNVLPTADFHQWVVTAELPAVDMGVKRLFPEYQRDAMGTALKQRLSLSEKAQSCTFAMMGLTLDLAPREIVNASGFIGNKFYEKYQKINAPANGASASKPMMLIQGLADTSVIPQSVIASFEDTCRFGNEVHLRLYPGLDHSATVIASAPEWTSWIDSLFEGKAFPSEGGHYRTAGKCTNITRIPVDLADAKVPVEIDFGSL